MSKAELKRNRSIRNGYPELISSWQLNQVLGFGDVDDLSAGANIYKPTAVAARTTPGIIKGPVSRLKGRDMPTELKYFRGI
jgi:hypothetical protein